jgi:hypothetical protein
MAAYVARAAGREPGWLPLPVQYADYALWHRELLGDESDPLATAAVQIRYWRSALAGAPDQLDLPVDRLRPAVQSYAGGRVAVDIDAETHAGLLRLAQEQGATFFMVMHTAFAVLLSRLTGTGDITIGTPIAGRGDRALATGRRMNLTAVRAVRADPCSWVTSSGAPWRPPRARRPPDSSSCIAALRNACPAAAPAGESVSLCDDHGMLDRCRSSRI